MTDRDRRYSGIALAVLLASMAAPAGGIQSANSGGEVYANGPSAGGTDAAVQARAMERKRRAELRRAQTQRRIDPEGLRLLVVGLVAVRSAGGL